MRPKALYQQSNCRTINIRSFFSASPYFWLGATDQFRSDKKWYWVQTEQDINSGYKDWYHTEPDNLGTYIFFNVFLTSPYNPDAYIFISRIFILLCSIIRVLISG